METQTYEEKKNTHPVEVPIQLPAEIMERLSHLPPAAAPMDWPVERFTQALGRRESNRQALLAWIAGNLKQGVDFGRIHVIGKDKCQFAKEGRAYQCDNSRHWSKPSLWKPGAEKICGMLGLVPKFPNISEYEKAALTGVDIKVILLKCELHTSTGFVAAEGTGARALAQDSGDINKSLKMAEKSAHIDATLRVAGLSEIFTQDLEDMLQNFGATQTIPPDDTASVPPQQTTGTQSQPPPRPPESQPAGSRPANSSHNGNGRNPPNNGQQGNGAANGGNRITGKQYSFIMDLMKQASMTKGELNKHCVEAYGSVVDHISRGDASSLIDWLRSR